MTRRRFTILSAALLLLSVAMSVWWVRSYWRQDHWRETYYQPSTVTRHEYSILSSKGAIGFRFGHETYQSPQFIYYRGDEHFAASGDLALPWTYDRITLPATGVYYLMPEPAQWWQKLGIFWSSSRYSSKAPWLSYSDPSRVVIVRWWFLALCFSVVPALQSINYLFTKRSIRGRRQNCRCVACGYDFRATPDRCPECGTVGRKAEG